jgi:hypothetical protein
MAAILVAGPARLVRTRPQIGHRLTLAFMTLAFFMLSVAEPSSMAYQLVELAGTPGSVTTWLLAAMACWSLVDVVINEVLPDDYTLARTRQWRHYGYGSMALLNGSFIFVMALHDQVSWLTSVYVVMALSAVWIAIWDVLTVVVDAHARA